MFMMSVARVAMLCKAHGLISWLLNLTTACHTPRRNKANVAHKCHNKHLRYWMFSAAPFDKLKVVAAAALLQDPSWGQVQTACHHVICVHVWLL